MKDRGAVGSGADVASDVIKADLVVMVMREEREIVRGASGPSTHQITGEGDVRIQLHAILHWPICANASDQTAICGVSWLL